MITLGAILAVIVAASPALFAVAGETPKDLKCGNVDTAAKRDVMRGTFDTWKREGNCTTPAQTCRRHWCLNTSAFYICNDDDKEFTIECKHIADYASIIAKQCCTKPYTESKGISGEMSTEEGWSIFVAYGNCKHGRDADRPGPAPDPYNGKCESEN
ncbi:hypothetical protein NKR23_g4986 [Pleurostoma richardsiae]|uniref:Secreted protein n=1 Tax=Pleurostoma richardsiae TaxID=41990 RepID=A0AA38RQG0_9PEZI|nr:hypothetical protein NKR23_g4986 [Pleurostoma richardsiae]